MMRKFLYQIKDALRTVESREKQRRMQLANDFLATGKSISEGLSYFRVNMDSIQYIPHEKVTKEDIYNILDNVDRRVYLHGLRGISFLNDKEIAMYAMGIDARLLEFFSDDVRNDRNVVYAALSGRDRNVLQFVGDKLYEDRDFQLLLLGILNTMVGGNAPEKIKGSNHFYETEEKYIEMIDEVLTRDDIMGLEATSITNKRESVIWSYGLREKSFDDTNLLKKILSIIVELNPKRRAESMAACLCGMGLSVNNKELIDSLWADEFLDFVGYRDLQYMFKKWDSYLGKTILEKFPEKVIYCDKLNVYPNAVKKYVYGLNEIFNRYVQSGDETILRIRLDANDGFIENINKWGSGYKKYEDHVKYMESFLDKDSVIEMARFGFIKMLTRGNVKVGRGIMGEKEKNIYAYFFKSEEEFFTKCSGVYLEELAKNDILGNSLKEILGTYQNNLEKKKIISYLKKYPEFKKIIHFSTNYYKVFSLKEVELMGLTYENQEKIVYDSGQLSKKDIQKISLEALVQNVKSGGRGAVVEDIFKVRPIHKELTEDSEKIDVLKHAFEKRLDFMFNNYLKDFEELWGKENVINYLTGLSNYRKEFNEYCVSDLESLKNLLNKEHNYSINFSDEIIKYVKNKDELKELVGKNFKHFSRLVETQKGFLETIDVNKEDVMLMIANAETLYDSKSFLESSLCDVEVISWVIEKNLMALRDIPENYFCDRDFLRKCAASSAYDGGAIGHLINHVPQKILKEDESFLELMDSLSIHNLRPLYFNGPVEDIMSGLKHISVSRLFLNDKFKQEWEKTYGTEVSIMEIIPTEPMAVKEVVAKIREREYQDDVDFVIKDVKPGNKVKKF